MANIPDHIYDLIIQSFQQSVTSAEKEILDNWENESSENQKALEDIYEIWVASNMIGVSKGKEEAWDKITANQKQSKIIRLNRTWISVAASIVIILSVLGGLKLNENIQEARWDKLNALAFETSSVKLITQSGEEINLSDSASQNLIIEGEKVENINHTITYESKESASTAQNINYHELVVPRGQMYNLTLSDGTVITLNSESNVKFPTAFTAKTRDVWVKGEVYFEVAHDKAKPFIVHSNGFDTKVLGTEFNVRTYHNEKFSTVTLVNGSVQLSSPNNENKMLKPGYQFSLLKNQEFSNSEIKKVNTYNVTAWKDGILFFDNMKLGELLNCLSRWYVFDYQFKDEDLKDRLYSGGIKKTDDLKKVFSLIEKVNDVEFSIKDNQILIRKK